MTRSEIRVEVRRVIAEQSAGVSYATDADLNAFINEGITDMCVKASVYERTQTTPVTTTVAIYTLPADFIKPKALLNHLSVFLVKIEPEMSGAVYIITGYPLYYYITQYPLAPYAMTLVDTPTTAGGGVGTYTLIYHALDVALASDAHSPNFPVDKHYALVKYGAYKHFLKAKNMQLALAMYVDYATTLGLPMTLPPQGGQGET